MPLQHDPLYKELIQALFKDFMQFALEDLYQFIDYQTVKFLDKEIIDVFTDTERRLDIFAEATIKNKKEIIYIHIEIESSKNQNFPFRMWDYFSQIHRKFKKPVIPIVLFVDDHQWTRKKIPDHYTVELFGREIMRFNYLLIKPKHFKVEDYLNFDNPFVKALLVKMDLSKVDAKKIKLGILRYLSANKKKLGKNGAMVYNFINIYCKLKPEDEKSLLNLTENEKEVKQMILAYKEHWIEKGQIIEKINSHYDEISLSEKELVRLNKLLDKKDITEKVYKTLASPIQTKISKYKKEISLLKNKQKRLPKD